MPRKPTIATPIVDVIEEGEAVDRPFEAFIEHQRKAFVEASKAFGSLLPKELREHGQSAVREMVEGYRTLFNATLDDLINTLEKARLEEEAGKTKVEDLVEENRKN